MGWLDYMVWWSSVVSFPDLSSCVYITSSIMCDTETSLHWGLVWVWDLMGHMFWQIRQPYLAPRQEVKGQNWQCIVNIVHREEIYGTCCCNMLKTVLAQIVFVPNVLLMSSNLISSIPAYCLNMALILTLCTGAWECRTSGTWYVVLLQLLGRMVSWCPGGLLILGCLWECV